MELASVLLHRIVETVAPVDTEQTDQVFHIIDASPAIYLRLSSGLGGGGKGRRSRSTAAGCLARPDFPSRHGGLFGGAHASIDDGSGRARPFATGSGAGRRERSRSGTRYETGRATPDSDLRATALHRKCRVVA